MDVDLEGEVLSQWPSEFARVDAGRVNARRFALPLIVHHGYSERTETSGRRGVSAANSAK